MSRYTGVNLYASGDQRFDERQQFLYNTILRLRAHLSQLKEKLEEEKALLSELKAENYQLTMQAKPGLRVTPAQTATTIQTEDFYQNSMPYYSVPENYPLPNESLTSFAGLDSYLKVYNSDFSENRTNGPETSLETLAYFNRLKIIDSLCKEEMARVSSVAEKMEPLKQIASDWIFETKLKYSGNPEVDTVEDRGAIAEPYFNKSGSESRDCNSEVAVPLSDDKEPHPLYPIHRSRSTIANSIDEDKAVDQPPKMQSDSTGPNNAELQAGFDVNSALKDFSTWMGEYSSVTDDDISCPQEEDKISVDLKKSNSTISLNFFESSMDTIKTKAEENPVEISMNDSVSDFLGRETSKKEAEEDSQSIESHLTSKSAVSLESIQMAFANHRKENMFELTKYRHEKRGTLFLDKRKNKDRKNHRRLTDSLPPVVKKVIDNWSGRGYKNTESPTKSISSKRSDETKAICEDDVVNKYLYDDEGYVYTPLFVSETDSTSDGSYSK